MASTKNAQLKGLFSSNCLPTLFSDDLELIPLAASLGFEFKTVAEVLNQPPPNILFVPSSWEWAHANKKAIKAAFSVCRVLTIPSQSFDGCLATNAYTLSRLLESNFDCAIKNGYMWNERLAANQHKLYIRGGDNKLVFEKSPAIAFNFNTNQNIAIGQDFAIGHYLEAELEALFLKDHPFMLNACTEIKALLVARHTFLPRECYTKITQAQQFIYEINHSGEKIWIEIENNVVKKFTVGNSDYLAKLNYFTNEAYGLTLTEFAFGLNRSIIENIDWSINSVINEGAGVLHFALGDGFSGAHIDFICEDFTEWTGPAEEGWQPIYS